METQQHNAIAAETALAFILAGHAIVTLVSLATGVHFTYRIDAKDGDTGRVYFVSWLCAPDTYAYLGMIRGNELYTTRASKAGREAPVFRAMRFALARPDSPQLEVHHAGRCGRCGRELTEPESLRTGIGPVCREKMGM